MFGQNPQGNCHGDLGEHDDPGERATLQRMWNQPGLGDRAIFKLQMGKDPPTLDTAGLAGIAYHTLGDLTLQGEVFVFRFFNFWLCWVLLCTSSFPSCRQQGLLSIVVASRCTGFSCGGARA